MRIGIVTGEYPPMQGGVGAYTAILARHLVNGEQTIYLFSTQQSHSDSVPLTRTINRWNYASLKAIQNWAKQQQIDLINLQFQTGAFQMSPWIHFLPRATHHIPVVTTFHDLRFPYLFPKAGRLRNWIVMHLARQSAGIIVTNHEDASRVRDIPNNKMIPIGSNILDDLPEDYDRESWRKKAGAKHDDLLLAHFGLINRSKGLGTLLHSMAQLRAQNIPARLLVIGGTSGTSDPTNSAYMREIDQLIHELELETVIQRTGYIEDSVEVGSYLRAGDAVVLPFTDGASFRRGSLMAAIHYGCPIVTTEPRVHVPEFIHGQNMLLFPPSDATALTTMLQQLHDKPEIAINLRTSATHLAKQFNWKQIASDYITFFEQVLRGTT